MTAANVNIIDGCFGNEAEIALDLASERDDYTSTRRRKWSWSRNGPRYFCAAAAAAPREKEVNELEKRTWAR